MDTFDAEKAEALLRWVRIAELLPPLRAPAPGVWHLLRSFVGELALMQGNCHSRVLWHAESEGCEI